MSEHTEHGFLDELASSLVGRASGYEVSRIHEAAQYIRDLIVEIERLKMENAMLRRVKSADNGRIFHSAEDTVQATEARLTELADIKKCWADEDAYQADQRAKRALRKLERVVAAAQGEEGHS